MMRPPHRLLAGMWREAEAVIGALDALRDAEQAVAALTVNPAAPLTDIAAIAWAFETPDGAAAIAQSLGRLRGMGAAPARRAYPTPLSSRDRDPGFGFGRAAGTMPELVGGLNSAGDARFAGRETGAPKAATIAAGSEPSAAPARRTSAAVTEAGRRAARQPIGSSPSSAEARRAVDLILNGLRPPAATLIAALDTPALDLPFAKKAAAALPPMTVRIDRALTAQLARVNAARGASTRRLAIPASFEPSRPLPSPPPAASGFRRLAALFAQPVSGPFPAMPEANPASAAASVAGASSPRQPVLPQPMASEATSASLAISRYVGEDAAAETDVAELLARVLRREARRQGIADEGGAA